jgi:ArsR family transcriptional regulator
MHDYRRMAGMLKGMGHPVRLRILEALLNEGEACVCHLEHHLGERQAYISQQLARLRSLGLVVDRREGLNIYYSLAHDSVGEIMRQVRPVAEALAASGGEPRDESQPVVDLFATCPCPKCRARQQETHESKSAPL